MNRTSRSADSVGRGPGERPPAPEPLPAPAVDSHCHLDIVAGAVCGVVGESASEGYGDGYRGRGSTSTGSGDAYRGDHESDGGYGDSEGRYGGPDAVVDQELATAAAVGIARVVQVGVDVASSQWSADLAARRPDVLATVALHPNEAGSGGATNEALAEIDRLAAHPRVRAVGETGLDRYRTGEDGWAMQEQSFRAHIDIAKRHGIALMVHTRDAYPAMLRVLDEEGAPEYTVLHCYSSDAETARSCLDRGLVLSFSGTVTFSNARATAEAAAITPLDQLLVETDAPFLTPTPWRGRPNAPYLTPYTIRALAELTGTDLETLCRRLTATAERIFGP